MPLLAGVLLAPAWASTPRLVQSASANNRALDRPTCHATFPSDNTAGNLVVVAVEVGAPGPVPHPVVHDSQGNTYYPATGQIAWLTTGNGASAQLFYAPNIRAGPNTVSMTEAGGYGGVGNAWNQMAIHEYAGLAVASPLDAAAVATGTTVQAPSPISTGSVTSTADGDLIFGYGNSLNAELKAGDGFTARETGAGTSEDMLQPRAGLISASELNNVADAPYVMLMAAFKPAPPGAATLTLPVQADRTVSSPRMLTITNTAAALSLKPVDICAQPFNYPNREALMADGWSFLARTAGGAARDTETKGGTAVSFDQKEHPGILRLACEPGDLFGAANNSRNSLFRELPPNWTSLRLELSFAPVVNYQQANLMLYQNDDNYVAASYGHNSELDGNVVRFVSEANGQVNYSFTAVYWYTGGPGTPGSTNLHLRLDRIHGTSNVSGFASLDGTNWAFVGTYSQALLKPRLGIWVGGSPASANGDLPQCDVRRLEIWTADLAPSFTYRLIDAPAGAQIGGDGVIIWSPSLAQFPSTNVFTTVVTDNRVPPLSATNRFTVVASAPRSPG